MTKLKWPLKIRENTWLYADGVWYTKYFFLIYYKHGVRCPQCHEYIEDTAHWKDIPSKDGDGGIYTKHRCGALLSAVNNLAIP